MSLISYASFKMINVCKSRLLVRMHARRVCGIFVTYINNDTNIAIQTNKKELKLQYRPCNQSLMHRLKNRPTPCRVACCT